ncbi:glutamate--tRNA ligase [Mycoplasma sp. 1018B]|uniref:glutamate--tRNA ligase n=1 Tax=Mycoplasma sp. 1018B TaxID=2967302 RepID=UPI00211CA0DF|nr:glutamate--tRNA ligase [Mycoplasma sp. 1018B]UUM19177.1 glutamate--tRNA ligase [Mycoplasma sp. 1018B]
MKKVRTRYAPSPTGYLHIGGARTALFCYLFAKHFEGDFIFRLEDTDIKRNVEKGEESQLKNLEWLGIIPDESPLNPNPKYGKYRQSEKIKRYQEIAQYLLDKGYAYKAYDTTEELEKQKLESQAKGIISFKYDKNWLKISETEKMNRDKKGEYSIRFSMPKNKEYQWNDLVRGLIKFESASIGDWVILKSDKYPTYNFAVVIDDFDMQITHILRGEEHITNTPKQLAIYDALNWTPPTFGHLTVITNMEGKKLSKRDLTLKQFIEDYKNEGYIPEAIFNFLTLLGWTDIQSREIMSHQEIIKAFDPNRLSKSPSKFDIKKMQWFSKQYLKNMSNSKLLEIINLEENNWNKLFLNTYKESVYNIEQLKKCLEQYQKPLKEFNFKFSQEELNIITLFKTKLYNSEFTIENLNNIINQISFETNKKGKALFLPIRLATTYTEHGPELAKAIYLFGENLIKERLNKWK